MIEKLVNWLAQTIQPILDWLLGLVTDVLDWALELVAWIPRELWASLLDALAGALEAIPAPAFLSQAGSFFGGIPSNIVYFFQFFAVAEGLGFIITALLLRFLLRRIPIIG